MRASDLSTLNRGHLTLMPVFILPFPAIDPVAVSVGPFIVRWYALAYIFGFFGCWAYASALLRKDRLWSDTPRPNPQSLIDLALYAMLGTVIRAWCFQHRCWRSESHS
jgi:phosphatidylglycerol:prolipoprotein diacylglycerol transferase